MYLCLNAWLEDQESFFVCGSSSARNQGWSHIWRIIFLLSSAEAGAAAWEMAVFSLQADRYISAHSTASNFLLYTKNEENKIQDGCYFGFVFILNYVLGSHCCLPSGQETKCLWWFFLLKRNEVFPVLFPSPTCFLVLKCKSRVSATRQDGLLQS